ncbi:hypothetical protein AJ80_06316 [Polytolypa hystricis UAMH7299]|uniref:LysM domain-containing protein n=1 Tax=Polytolypa hystricis (strain UAMH7299) TaxID=1447883 RepID=A0A2B7XY93_POLH7|nr:hypothetical protein AJ80_06316 [Polytolypa hystricis UAMH7299]
MDFRKLPLVALMSSQLVMASFNLFGPYDQEVAPASLGISRQCFAAVNQSVSCDPVNAVRAAHGVDDEYWFVDDITSLCTNECRDSLSAWLSTVDYECANEVLTMDDRPIEPKSFPLRYMAGFEIACLQDSAQNWCFFDSQQWEETASASWDPHPCRGDDPLAECGDEEIFITEHSPDMAVTDAYPQEIYCSECFILLWKQRILSPQVSDEIIDYLVEQLGMLEGSCSSSISLSATSTAIVERAMPPAIPTDNSWATAKASANLEARLARETYYSAGKNSILQLLTALEQHLKAIQDTPTAPTHPGSIKPCGQYYNVAPGDTCNSVADRFGISVYDLRRYNKELARDCFNMWANYALCVAPVAKRPVLADGRCGPDNGNAECEGSSFGSLRTDVVIQMAAVNPATSQTLPHLKDPLRRRNREQVASRIHLQIPATQRSKSARMELAA